MKKQFTKMMSVVLSLLMLCTALPLTAWASAEYVEWYYTYTVNNGEATITDVDESISGDVTIPSTLGGYTVTEIGDEAFACCTNLKSVTISDCVISIGKLAFGACTSLESITISDGVISIGSEAFSYCINLASITMPDSVTNIGAGAFGDTAYYNNSDNWVDGVLYIGNHLIESQYDITECIIKDGTLTIADNAFAVRPHLESVTIPDSVTSIGVYAFVECENLKNITIPNSVTSIGSQAFFWCGRLESITILNPHCEISDYESTIDLGATIYGYEGSTAQAYAEKHSFTFVVLEHGYNAVVTAPTCKAKGYTTYTCACGDSYVADYTDMVDHIDTDCDYMCDYNCGYAFEKTVKPELPEISINVGNGFFASIFAKLLIFLIKIGQLLSSISIIT